MLFQLSDYLRDASKTGPCELHSALIQWLASFPKRKSAYVLGSCNRRHLLYWFFVSGKINRVRLFAFLDSVERKTKLHSHVCHDRLWRNTGIFAKNIHDAWSLAVGSITKRLCKCVARWTVLSSRHDGVSTAECLQDCNNFHQQFNCITAVFRLDCAIFSTHPLTYTHFSLR